MITLMHCRLRVVPLVLALVTSLVLVTAARGEIYRYVDERGNAAYADGLDSVPERHRALAVPTGLTNKPAGAAPTPVEGASTNGVTTIRFAPGQRIVADAWVNGTVVVKLLVDTGADRTLIAPRMLTAAGAPPTRPAGRGVVAGVTGRASADAVVIETLAVGEARVGRMVVIAHDMGQPGLDGLLGRDFLDHFSVGIDPAKGRVTIGPR
jgi:predicted aspartyl protease